MERNTWREPNGDGDVNIVSYLYSIRPYSILVLQFYCVLISPMKMAFFPFENGRLGLDTGMGAVQPNRSFTSYSVAILIEDLLCSRPQKRFREDL